MVKPVHELMRDQCDFYLDPVTSLLQAWYIAEGGRPSTFIKAIQCSLPNCVTVEEALARGAKTIRSAMVGYCSFCARQETQTLGPLFTLVKRKGTDPWTGEANPRRVRFTDAFIAFLGAKVAPVGVANDPTGINKYWIGNVQDIYRELLDGIEEPTRTA